MKTRFFVFLALSLMGSKAVFADFSNQMPEKVYVSIDQLWIDESGIFVNLAGNVQPIAAIFRDAEGLYVNGRDLIGCNWQPQYQCPNGHPSPFGDGRCNQKKAGCPYAR